MQSAPAQPQGGPPIIIDSAAVAAASAAAAQSGTPAPVSGATNIFVINAGHSPQPAPAPPPPTPTEIHHHHTTVQYVPRKRTPHYNTSFFASAGLVLGGLAAACAYESGSYLPFAWPLAMAGLAAGGIAFVGAILFRRTRTGLAVFALLLSAAAYVGWLYNSNQLQSQIDEIRRQLPKVDLGQPTAASVPPKAR